MFVSEPLVCLTGHFGIDGGRSDRYQAPLVKEAAYQSASTSVIYACLENPVRNYQAAEHSARRTRDDTRAYIARTI